METILTKTKTNSLINSLSKILILAILAIVIPAFIHVQWATGPIVNAILFLSVVYCGLSGAIIIGMIPSVIALSAGLLPAPLAPAVPYIMLGNAVMVVVFSYFYKKNFWAGVILGSLLKFALLFSTMSIVINLLMNQKIASQISAMLNWPQLATALAGGVFAQGMIRILKRAK